MFEAHSGASWCVFPPRKNERFPLLSSVRVKRAFRRLTHLGHLKRKCLTISLAVLHKHRSESVTLILCRYPLSRDMPARNWTNTAASFRLNVSYSFLVWVPGNALSNSLENRPMCGGIGVSPFFANAALSTVALALGQSASSCGIYPCCSALLAAFFACAFSSFEVWAGVHVITTVFELDFSICLAR